MLNKEQLQALYISTVRTAIPFMVGAVVTFLRTKGIEITDEQQTQVIVGLVAASTALFGAAYYMLVRVVEHFFPKAGWLLGVPKKPTY